MGVVDVSRMCRALVYPELVKLGFERKGARLYRQSEDRWWGWVSIGHHSLAADVSSFFLHLEFAPLLWIEQFAEPPRSVDAHPAGGILPKPGWGYDRTTLEGLADHYSALPSWPPPQPDIWSFETADERSMQRCADELCEAFAASAVPWFEERLDPVRVREAITWSEDRWFLRY